MEQSRAINSSDGPLIIISCPGSGKTTTLLRRIVRLIEKGADPSRILMVTFTKDAADEMAARYNRLTGGQEGGVTFSTIHALCNRMLEETGILSGMRLLTERDSREMLVSIMSYYKSLVDDKYEMAVSLLREFSEMRNKEIPLEAFTPRSCRKDAYEMMYRWYVNQKTQLRCYDFDDMIIAAREVLRRDRGLLWRMQQRYDYIQCDEYQDTNSIQRDILYMLAGERANLCVVGDDDQAIYGFRGTRSGIMLEFESDFAKRGMQCQTVSMQTNFRCMKKIVDVSTACIEWNRHRLPKTIISDKGRSGMNGRFEYIRCQGQMDEARRVLDIIKRRHEQGVPYSEIAVLYRTNRQASAPAQFLSAEGIPYYVRDRLRCIYDEWMFRGIRAYAEMSMGIDVERNMLYVLNRPSRYLSPQCFRGIPFTSEGMLRAIEDKKNEESWKYSSAQKAVFDWLNCFGPGKISPEDPPQKLFKGLTGKGSVHYDKYIKERAAFMNEQPEDLKAEYEELKKEAFRFRTVGDWFRHADMMSRLLEESSRGRDVNGVRLSTIHGAKGLEWNTVIVIGAGQKNMPGTKIRGAEDLEEERRILYVGMTRAIEELYVTCYGQESEFMTQTMSSLKEKEQPAIRKKMKGSVVVHKRYGKGKIVRYTSDRVFIDFPEEGVKKFKYPDAFINGHLKA